MGLLDTLRVATGADSDTQYECRDCGTAVADDVDECPECGSDEIASYSV